MVHFDPINAVRDNFLVVVLVLVLLLRLIPGSTANRLSASAGRWLSAVPPPAWVGLLIVWTLFRNLPGLTWLSPDR